MRTREASECSRRLSQLDAQRGVLLLQSLVLRIRIRPDDSVANPKTCLESARGWLHLGVPAEISLVGWSAFLSRSTAVFKPRGAAPLLDASLRPSSTLRFATRLTSHRGSLSSLRSSSHPRFAVPHRGPQPTPAPVRSSHRAHLESFAKICALGAREWMRIKRAFGAASVDD